MSVFHASVLAIGHEFRHNIVKVAVDPRDDSRVDPQTTLTILWRNSLSITGQMWENVTIEPTGERERMWKNVLTHILVVGWPHRSMMLSMWLRDAVMSYAVSRYLTLWLRDAARVKYPHFTLAHHRVSSSSVVWASVLDLGGSWVRIPSGTRIFPSSQWVQLQHLSFNNRTDAWKADINLFLQWQKGRGVKIKSKHDKKVWQKSEKLQSDASNIASLSHKL